MLLVTQIYAPQDTGISLIKRYLRPCFTDLLFKNLEQTIVTVDVVTLQQNRIGEQLDDMTTPVT